MAISTKNIFILLALSFVVRFLFSFKQMCCMFIFWTSLSVLGPRLRSQWLFLEIKQHIHDSSSYIYRHFLTQLSITTISWTNSSIGILGPRLRSQWLFVVNITFTLPPSFMNRFWCNFKQMVDVIISWPSWGLSFLGIMSWSKCSFFKGR